MTKIPNHTAVYLALLIVALAGAILIFVPGLLDQFETPKAEVVRVCGITALAIALAAGRRAWGRWQALDVAVLAWLVVEMLATLTSVAPAISLFGSPSQREGLVTSLGLAGIYAAARQSSRRPAARERIFDTLLLAASLASLYAIAQAAGLDPSPWRGTADYVPGLGYRRPFGTLGHANLLGVVVAAALPIAWARAAGSAPAWRRFVAPVLALAAQLGLSRAAWLGAVTGSIVSWALLARDGGRRVLRRVIVPAGAAVVALALGFLFFRAALGSRIAEIASTGGSGASRIEIWRGALAAWRMRPILGHGPDTFELVFPHVRPAAYWRLEWSLEPVHAHSIYLHTLATRGVVGLLAGLLLVAALFVTLRAASRNGGEARRLVAPASGAFAAIAIAGAFGALGVSGAAIAFAVAGLLVGTVAVPAGVGASATAERSKPSSAAEAPTPAVVLVAGGVAAAVVIAWAGVEIGASWSAGEARERLAGEPAAAAAAAERASSLAPWDDTYFRMTAECLERAASGSRDRAATLARAEEAARRAVALAPERASNHLRLASVLAGSLSPGDSVAGGAAAAEFERSLALAPTDGVAWMELARLDLYLGRPQAALAPAERALTLYPSLAGPEVLRARAWLALGERDRAVMALERALAADWQGRDDERRAASDLLERVRAPSGGTR